MPRSRGAVRSRSLAALHAGKRALGWDDETYRAFVHGYTGRDSAADCTVEQLASLLDQMRARGFQRAPGAKEYSTTQPRSQLDKARALWGELDALGALRSPGEAGFCAYVERMTGRSRPEWCTPEQLSRVIEGLKAWTARERRAAASDRSLD